MSSFSNLFLAHSLAFFAAGIPAAFPLPAYLCVVGFWFVWFLLCFCLGLGFFDCLFVLWFLLVWFCLCLVGWLSFLLHLLSETQSVLVQQSNILLCDSSTLFPVKSFQASLASACAIHPFLKYAAYCPSYVVLYNSFSETTNKSLMITASVD